MKVGMQVPEPNVGDWYRKPSGRLVKVVAMDDLAGTVEMQHFDGTVEEVDLELWSRTVVMSVDAPEDWSGSVDVPPEDGCQFADDAEVGHRPYLNVMDYTDRLD
jgi:hypothetical protein